MNTGDSVSLFRGPVACAPNSALSTLMVRFLGVTPYQVDVEGRDCVVYGTCNFMFLFLGEISAACELSRLHKSITLASARCLPRTEGCPVVNYLLK